MRDNSRHRVKALLVRERWEVEWLRAHPGEQFVERDERVHEARYPGTCRDCTFPLEVGQQYVRARVGDEHEVLVHRLCQSFWPALRDAVGGRSDADVVVARQPLAGAQRCARCGSWLEAGVEGFLVSTLRAYDDPRGRAEWVGACCVVWGVTPTRSPERRPPGPSVPPDGAWLEERRYPAVPPDGAW